MADRSHPVGGPPPSQWPPNAQPYYRPVLLGAIAASLGIMIGTLGPWVSVVLFTINGLDVSAWGITILTVGALSAVALLVILFWTRTPLEPRWSVSLAWAVAVGGVACLTFALPTVVRIVVIPKTNILGFKFGPTVGWGLWLLTISSAALCVTAIILALHLAKSIELLGPIGQSATPWIDGSRWGAIIASALIVLAGIVYFSLNWSNSLGGGEPSKGDRSDVPSFPSFTMPSFPSFPDYTTPSETP